MQETPGNGSNNGAGMVPVYGAGPITESRYGMGQAPVLQEAGIDVRQCLGLLRARFWTVLACLVVVFTLAAVRTFRAAPVYEASARLLIERRYTGLTPLEGVRERGEENNLETEVNLMTSRAVLEEALKDERLARLFGGTDSVDAPRPGLFAQAVGGVRNLFGSEPNRPLEAWERLQNALKAQRVRETNLVYLKARGSDPVASALVANAVAEAYVSHTVALRQANAFEAFEMLQVVRKEQEVALTSAEDALLKYRKEATIPLLGPPGEGSAVVDRLKALDDEYTGVQMRRIELSVAAKAIAQAQGNGQDVDSLLAIREIREDPGLGNLLQSLDDEYRAIQSRRIELDAAAEAIAEAQGSNAGVAALLAIGLVRDDPTAGKVRDRLAQVEMDIGAALRAFGEKHPQVVGLREERNYLVARLGEAVVGVAASIGAEQRLLRKRAAAQKMHIMDQLPEATRSAAKGIETEYALLLQREKEITQALKEQNQVALAQAGKSHGYQRLKRDMERQSQVFGAIVDRMKVADLSKDVGVTNISLVDPATAPRTPIKPNKKRALVFGGLLGLILGVGVAYLLEHLDDTVKTPEDVERGLGVPWLGYVPEIEAEGAGRVGMSKRATQSITAPSSSTTESFRSIRTNIYFSGEKDEIKSLVISSAVPKEGKTVFSSNLASTIAQDGKRVLLVDADLRRPSIHAGFGLERGPGLTNMLVEGRPLDELVKHPPQASNGQFENLHILTAGSKTPNPADLLGGEAMARFVREARETYDMVIFDTAPAMFVADAAPLTSGCDGVIMVVRAARTKRGAADRARRQLEAVKGKIIGAVLNGVRPRVLRGYGYSQYGYGTYYYDYHRYCEEYADEPEAVEA